MFSKLIENLVVKVLVLKDISNLGINIGLIYLVSFCVIMSIFEQTLLSLRLLLILVLISLICFHIVKGIKVVLADYVTNNNLVNLILLSITLLSIQLFVYTEQLLLTYFCV
jgi:succinate dehydrogenase hydrophobic anchor subunit